MRNFKNSIYVGALALTLTACEPVHEEKGYRLDEDQVAKVEAGITTKDDVIEVLGSPSSIATFPEQGDAWYYISKTTKHFAFLEKELVDQNVIVIKFDENEVVKEIKNYGLDDHRKVETVDRTTPTGGNELGFFEQIFGNFGRFNN